MHSEAQSLFPYLQTLSAPLYLYGMGNGAEKIKKMLDAYQLPLAGVFASDDFVRGHSFLGMPVGKYAELPADAVILLAFGGFTEELLERFDRMASEHRFFAPDLPLFGEEYFSMEGLAAHRSAIERAYRLLADEQSRLVFRNTIAHKISGEIPPLRAMETPKSELYELLSLGENEVYFDLGAYDGDTVREFLAVTGGKHKGILALEPDVKNFGKLCRRMPDISAQNIGVYSHAGELAFSTEASRNSSIRADGKRRIAVETIDRLAAALPPTFIKMDVEGSEAAALEGGRQTLADTMPKLLVSAYHRTWDFCDLILLLHEIQPAYRLYLRHQPYVPNWETNLIALPPQAES